MILDQAESFKAREPLKRVTQTLLAQLSVGQDDARDSVVAQAEVLEVSQRIDVLDRLDLVLAQIKLRQVDKWVQILDSADFVVVQDKCFQINAAFERTRLYFPDFVAG